MSQSTYPNVTSTSLMNLSYLPITSTCNNVTMSQFTYHNVTINFAYELSVCTYHNVTIDLSQCNNPPITMQQSTYHNVTIHLSQCHNKPITMSQCNNQPITI